MKTVTRIEGTVRRGTGQASKVPDWKMEGRSAATGMRLQRGTLNVHPASLNAAVQSLGEPHSEIDEQNNKQGLLRFWDARLTGSGLPEGGIACVVVRHVRTRTRYLELMSNVQFMPDLLSDDDHVVIELMRDGPDNATAVSADDGKD